MLCIFLENTPPRDDLLITIKHNEDTYTFSRDLTLKHSQKISDLLNNQEEENTINLDYEHIYDDFQLIADLFNYKRIFINRLNIDFLEYSANYLQIPVLIKKTEKYRNHYNDFLKDPIFKELRSLRKQVFSIGQLQCNSDDESDSDYEDDTTNDNTTNSNTNHNENSNSNENNNEIITEKDDKKETNADIENDNKTNTDNNQEINEITKVVVSDETNEETKEYTHQIKYRPGYSSSVTHIIYSACIADPLNAEKYLQIVKNDPEIYNDFQKNINSNLFLPTFNTILLKYLLMKISHFDPFYFNSRSNYLLDTNLSSYFNEIDSFYHIFHSHKKSLEIIISIIKDDDIGSLQQMNIAHTDAFTNKEKFSLLFQVSMIASSIKCFKYFLLNCETLFHHFKFDKNLIRPSIIGGNIEIFRTLLDRYSGSPIDFLNDAILYQKNDILKWIIVNHVQFLSLYNSCCSKVLYGEKFIKQKWYECRNCYPKHTEGCCKFCAKHCHVNNDGEVRLHNPKFNYISTSCYCDDECMLSQNMEPVGNKEFVEIDDLILLAVFCLNTGALKILIDEGGYILRCRDRVTKEPYIMNDQKLNELIVKMRGYKVMNVEEIGPSNENQLNSTLFGRLEFMRNALARVRNYPDFQDNQEDNVNDIGINNDNDNYEDDLFINTLLDDAVNDVDRQENDQTNRYMHQLNNFYGDSDDDDLNCLLDTISESDPNENENDPNENENNPNENDPNENE